MIQPYNKYQEISSSRLLTEERGSPSKSKRSLGKKQLPLITDVQQTQPSSLLAITQRTEMKNSRKFFELKKNKLESNRIQRERECQDIYQNIANQRVTQKYTLYELEKVFIDNFAQITNIKNEKYAILIMIKLIQSVPKIQEVLDIHKGKFLGINAEQMIKQIIHHWLDQSIFQDYKKFKLDQNYINSVDEINKKFEETLLNLYDEQINSFSTRMINSIYSLKEKQFYVEGQAKMAKKSNLQLYQKTLQLIDRKPNYRALTSDVVDRLQGFEEKLGKFDLIQNRERRKQITLNLFVQRIRSNSKYNEK